MRGNEYLATPIQMMRAMPFSRWTIAIDITIASRTEIWSKGVTATGSCFRSTVISLNTTFQQISQFEALVPGAQKQTALSPGAVIHLDWASGNQKLPFAEIRLDCPLMT